MENYRYLISAHNDELANSATGRPRFFVRTYGCQMNSRDSEKLSALLARLGYDAAAGQDDADLILYNTCCVRENAEDKIFGHLGRLKRAKADKPGLIIAVCGCMTQQAEIAETIRAKHRYINLVFGTGNRHRLPEFLWRVISGGKQVIDISEDEGLPEITDVPATTREFPHKAGVNIMYGCDNYCSYCIVPYVRGREKSRPVKDVLQEVRELAADGVKEIMLLGQNVNSYAGSPRHSGLDPESSSQEVQIDSNITTFPQLLYHVSEIPGIERIRFMTSHPKDCSNELIRAIAELPKVCKSIHLPIQSGSTKVLRDMNRKYSREDYLELVERLRAAVPGIAISTDIIVGYPGETDEDFEDTLDIVRRVRFHTAFTFMYSKRSGTPAAQRTDSVPQKVASERFDRLVAELRPILEEINEAKIGHVFDVMVEEVSQNQLVGKSDQLKCDLPKQYKGRTDDHSLVHFTAWAVLQPGDIVPVRVESVQTYYCRGVAVE